MNIPSPSGNQTWLAGKSSPLQRCGNPMLYLRIPLGNVGFHKLNWERNTNTNGGQWFRVESKQIGILSNTNWVSKPKKWWYHYDIIGYPNGRYLGQWRTWSSAILRRLRTSHFYQVNQSPSGRITPWKAHEIRWFSHYFPHINAVIDDTPALKN